MSGFDYQRETVAKGSAFRRIVLFGAIGLLTAGGLWLLAPSGSKAPEKKAETPTAEGTSVGGEASRPETLQPEDGTVPATPASEEKQLPVSEETPSAENTDAPAEATETPAEGAEKSDAASEANATAVPEKDRPWVGDPPAAEDAPLTPPDGNAGVGSAPVLYSLAWRKQAKELTRRNWDAVTGKDADGAVETVSHKVVTGDSLSRLAARYHCASDAIRLRNGLKDDRIRLGMKLVIVPGPWRVEVSKSARVLSVYRKFGGKETLFMVFDVGIGRLGKTPSADFTICARLRHPTWYAPDGGVYPYGDAGNPLGDYFLKLAVSGRDGRPLRGFGIHGTRNEADVTRSRSNGCIRMRNRDVERLYQLLPVGTPVRIAE